MREPKRKQRKVAPRILIATIKSWNIKAARALQRMYPDWTIKVVSRREDLTLDVLKKFAPNYIFFPHWCWFITEEIFTNYETVIFHMTDLPYGRGGSPLQNLIVRGHKKTMISAVRAERRFDAGPVYLKKPLCLRGSATQIFERAAKIIFVQMIPQIVRKRLTPLPQHGRPTFFRRRKPGKSRIPPSVGIERMYDYIRMLDAEGYPLAYIDYGKLRLEFSRVEKTNGFLKANVSIKNRERCICRPS